MAFLLITLTIILSFESGRQVLMSEPTQPNNRQILQDLIAEESVANEIESHVDPLSATSKSPNLEDSVTTEVDFVEILSSAEFQSLEDLEETVLEDQTVSAEPETLEVEMESYQSMKYSSVLSTVNVCRRSMRLYLQKLNIDDLYHSEKWIGNYIYLEYACTSYLEYLSENQFLDFDIAANHMTLGQLFALNSTVLKNICNGLWDYRCIYNLPVGYFPLIPSSAFHQLNDEDVINLLPKINAVADRLLPAQRAQLVRKIIGVPLSVHVAELESCNLYNGSVADMIVPSGDFLSLVPLNYFRQLNEFQLQPFVSKLPINSPQGMLYSQVLVKKFSSDPQLLSNYKLVLTLPAFLILKLDPWQVLFVLKTLSSMPEPYTPNYEMVKCLHEKYVEYLNMTYAAGGAVNQESLMALGTNTDHETAGGLVLAHFSTEAWNSLQPSRRLKLISIVGRLSVVRLMMIQPYDLLLQLATVALKCMDITSGSQLDERSIEILGNLINFVNPKYIDDVNSDVFKKTIPRFCGFDFEVNKQIAVFVPPCHQDLTIHALHKKIIKMFGDPETWTNDITATVSCLLYVLDIGELSRIPKEYLVNNAHIIHDCWLARDNDVDHNHIRIFYNGICRRNLGHYYYLVRAKINEVLGHFKRGILEVAQLVLDDRRKQIRLANNNVLNASYLPNGSTALENHPCDNLCPAVQELGSIKLWTVSEIKKLSADEFRNCLDFMGARYLQQNLAAEIWKKLVQVMGPPESLSKAILMQLGSVIRGIPNEDFAKLKLDDDDVLGEFGQVDLWTVDDYSKLKSIAVQVKKQFKSHVAYYTSGDFLLLGQIICGLPIDDLESICHFTFANAIGMFSQIECPPYVTEVFAKKVVNNNVFGLPKFWGPGILNAVGTILGGLTFGEIRSIPACAFNGISPRAAITLPLDKFEELTQDQMLSFPPEAVTSLQLFGIFEQLNIETKNILQQVLYNHRPDSYHILEECLHLRWEVFNGSINGDEDEKCLKRDTNVVLSSKGILTFSLMASLHIYFIVLLFLLMVMNRLTVEISN